MGCTVGLCVFLFVCMLVFVHKFAREKRKNMNPQVEKVICKKVHVAAGLAGEHGYKVVFLNKAAVTVAMLSGCRLLAEYNKAQRLFDLFLDGLHFSRVSPALFVKKCDGIFAVGAHPTRKEANCG